MYGAKFIFNKTLCQSSSFLCVFWLLVPFTNSIQEFTAWTVIALIWLFITLGIASFYPLVDGGIAKIWIVLKDKKEGLRHSKGPWQFYFVK
jgi:hypothetical protein